MSLKKIKFISKNLFVEHIRATLLRGGRMSKYKGQAASYAPDLGIGNPGAGIATIFTGTSTRLRTSVSGGALMMAMMMPGLAHAQALPAGCTPDPATNGATVTCVAPPTPITGITTTVDDLTVNVGDATTPTTVNEVAGTGVSLTGSGTQTLNVYNAGSSITGSVTGARITVTGGVGDLTLNSEGAISGGGNGIYAYQNGSGALSITTQAVTGTNDKGIFASNKTGTSLTITTQGAVLGGDDGIYARNFGTAGLTITVGDDVTGATSGTNYGINAYNSANDVTASMVINQAAGTITTGAAGIVANNKGGSLTINALGTTIGASGYGIAATNNAGTTDLTITANNINGLLGGVRAINSGTGAVVVTTTGTLNSTFKYGIIASNSAAGTDLSIVAQGNIYSFYSGIRALNLGSGSTSITTSGGVSSASGSVRDGIYVRTAATATSLFVTTGAGAVTGDADGIEARNLGTAGLTITAGGNVTGTNGQGINAYNSANDVTASMVINQAVGTVTTGALNGIFADNFGGSLTINALGTTIGLANDGINADNNVGTTDLTITANTVTGATNGISANSLGTGSTSITTTGTITGTTGRGIDTRNTTAGTSLTINAQGAVSGATGFFVRNKGSGALSITSQTVTGTASVGINAINSAAGTSLTVDAQSGAVSGETDGLFAFNYGSDALSITSQAVTGTTNVGINTYNSAAGTDLTVNAQGAVSGAIYGIRARNYGSGALSITIQAVTATANNGISAFNAAAGTSLTINAQGAVSGGVDGIGARNLGTGVLSITSNSAISAGTGYGIRARTGAGGTTTITLNSGAAVASAAGLGIFNDAGNSTTTVNTGASVAGTISLGDGSDNLNFSGGDFSAVTLFDGGDDSAVADTFIDTLTFAGSSGALTGANIVNWENVVIDAESTISFADNALSAGSLTINAIGTLGATGGALVLTTDVTNNGTINARDGAANDTVTVTGNYTGTGSLLIDVDLAADIADTLVVNGNVTGGATIITMNVVSSGAPSGNDVLVVDVTGTSTAGDFVLGNPKTGAFVYQLAQVGNDFFLQQAGFNTATPTFEAYPQILLEMNTLPTLRQRMPNFYSSGSNSAGIQPAGGNTGNRQTGPIWARIEGARSDMEANTSTTGSSYDVDQWKIRVGIDGLIRENDNGRWLVGVNGFYGRGYADISSASGNGSLDTTGFGLGLNTTWYGNEGYYVDAQAQFSWFSSDLSDVTNGTLDNNNKGTGYAFNLEAGKRLGLSNGWTLTPQVQLVYSAVDFDSFTGGGAEVKLDNGDSLKGRVGINLDQKRSWTGDNGSTSSSKIYGLANLYYEFSGKSRVNVSGVTFINQSDKLSGEIGAGGSYNWDDNKYSLYGEVSTATSLENFGESYQLKGIAGIRVKF